jgi:hypothetical protein
VSRTGTRFVILDLTGVDAIDTTCRPRALLRWGMRTTARAAVVLVVGGVLLDESARAAIASPRATARISAALTARRMCNEAVQLVDRVLPNVPIRQGVLSLPWELRGLAATKPEVLGVMDKIFAQEIARAAKRLAAIAGAETGSIGCPQLFGGSLNVHPHLHTLCADGVFERTTHRVMTPLEFMARLAALIPTTYA